MVHTIETNSRVDTNIGRSLSLSLSLNRDRNLEQVMVKICNWPRLSAKVKLNVSTTRKSQESMMTTQKEAKYHSYPKFGYLAASTEMADYLTKPN